MPHTGCGQGVSGRTRAGAGSWWENLTFPRPRLGTLTPSLIVSFHVCLLLSPQLLGDVSVHSISYRKEEPRAQTLGQAGEGFSFFALLLSGSAGPSPGWLESGWRMGAAERGGLGGDRVAVRGPPHCRVHAYSQKRRVGVTHTHYCKK